MNVPHPLPHEKRLDSAYHYWGLNPGKSAPVCGKTRESWNPDSQIGGLAAVSHGLSAHAADTVMAVAGGVPTIGVFMTEKSTTTNEAAVSATTQFADDDLGRLQGILFGDHARKTTERIDTLEQALLGAIADIREELTSQVKDLSKRIDSEAATRAKAHTNVTERLSEEIKTRSSEAKKMQRQIDGSVDKLNAAVEEATADARLENESSRRELVRMIETTEADLRDYAVDRRALAGLLSSTADQLDAGANQD